MDGYLPSAYVYGLEVAIKNHKKNYQDKVSALLSGWERLASLSNTSSGAVNNLAECLYRDTLTLVLKGHWPKLSPATKTHLSVTLQRCVGSLICPSALKKCRDLIGLVNNPWGNPTLTGILNNPEGIDDAAVLEFCLSEKDSMLFMRLETLCDSKCEDLALKLARACLHCLRLPDTRFRDVCSQEEFNYILDLYIFLLYKFKNVQEIINELKHLDLKEGLELVRRYSATKNANIPARIWKNNQKVAELAAQYFLAVAMVKPVTETVGLLKELMTEWAVLHCRDDVISENLSNMIRKLIQPAESALHVYVFIEVLVDKFGNCLKSLCIELYIRGLTMDMNELEHQKVVGDEDKVKETEVRLSYGFQKLADLLKDNIGVSRECILTAFSLYPTETSYKQIREMAIASGMIKPCSSQTILRKRKTKIPLKIREERTCKSIYRRKIARVTESDSSCHSPTSMNRYLKKSSVELSNRVTDIQSTKRTINSKSSPVESKSPCHSHQCESAHPENDQLRKENRVNFITSDCGENMKEVSKSSNQNDASSSNNWKTCHNTSSRGDGSTGSGEISTQKGISLEAVNPNLRSRSSEIDTTMDMSSSLDVDSSKRSRSKHVNERNCLSQSENGRSRYRSDDEGSDPCASVTSISRKHLRRPIRIPKCMCEGCEEVNLVTSSNRRRRRSFSGECLNVNQTRIENSSSEPDLSISINDVSGSKNVDVISKPSPSESDVASKESQLPKPTAVVERITLSDDDIEDGNTCRRSRSQTKHGKNAQNGEPKRRGNSCSELDVGSERQSLSKQKSLSDQDMSCCHDPSYLARANPSDKCNTDGRNETSIDETIGSCIDNDNCLLEKSDLTCKVCSLSHEESAKLPENPKLIVSIHSMALEKAKTFDSVSESDGSQVKSSLNYDVLSAPNEVLDAEKLGLTSQLCDDLAVVLSSPRWHMLSWVLDWSQLNSLCERYLQDRDGMRNITKELKYLNIDYNQFKDKPNVDGKSESSGIEKGYEQWVDVGSDHSEQELMYTSKYSKLGSMQSQEDTDSDSSLISQRQKSSVNSPDSSQSDLEYKVKKHKKKPSRISSISDSDTGTQDSKSESLGSDGCCKEKGKLMRHLPECRKKKIPLVKRIAEKRLDELSKIRLIVSEVPEESDHDSRSLSGNPKEVMTIFSQTDEDGKKITSKQFSDCSFSSSVSSVPGSETKRDTESKALKSLRMFRPNHLKSVRNRICLSSSSECNKQKAKSNEEAIKFAPMLSTLNMNPRILLTRADVSSHYLSSKNVSPFIGKNSKLSAQQTKSNGINSKPSPCLSEKKGMFSSNRKTNYSKSSKRISKKLDGLRPELERITQAVIESQLLARTVPGLNSLDMMVPPPSEPTVQVIQLPHNPPSSTSTNHSSTTVSTTQKVTTTQGVQTSSPTQKVTTTQGVQTSPISTPQKLTVTQGVQISPGLVVGEAGPSTISHCPDDHWQAPHLGVSSADNASHNIPTFTSTSSQGPPCSSFLGKDGEDLNTQENSESSSGYQMDEKKVESSVEKQAPSAPVSQIKSDGSTENVEEEHSAMQSKSLVGTTPLDGSAISGGSSSVLDSVNSPKIPKAFVSGVDISKVISSEIKSCEDRSSEDELEKRLTRTFSGANSSDYCFPLKRDLGDGKTADSPWRYVPVVKRVSVSHGKAVPVDSALMRPHVESEACLSLPRLTDSLPDDLKGGESDDGCRSNFTSSIGTPSVKRRLFSDEVLEYGSYPSAKKPDKMKRGDKLNRVPDAIEREFRQTRLELEKELRLQKSLSEECEDLGVDEPSTSDLFPEADLLLDPNPSPSYDQTMPDTSCPQNVDSSEPFSSSDFRSVDSSSSVEGVHDIAGCSKAQNVSGSKTGQRKEKISPARPRKYLLRHRGEKKKWISVRNHHGSLEYRKVTKDDVDKKQPHLQRPSRVSPTNISTGSLNGSNTLPQSNVAISTFTSSSGEDSLSQHPIEGTTHTTTPTFSSDITFSPPQDDTVASPNSQTSQILDIPTAPTAAQKFITYEKKGQFSKEYSHQSTKRPRVCQFINYMCEQGDSRDTCDSWDSSNSVEKESTSESSKCGGRTFRGLKDLGSPSTSQEEDDDGKSISDYQEHPPNRTSFSNLLPVSNPSKLSQENMEESVLEGIEDDNAIANGIECDDDKCPQKKSILSKSSLRKHVMEKNAKKHILDKIDLYPRVCLKKWKGKDSITCSRYALELQNVSTVPTGSKHFSCVERPLLESESSVSSDPSSENSSKTSVEQNIPVGHLGLSNSLVVGKDGEFSIQSECPNQSSVLKASRRSSLRDHVKRGCPCCNGSPEPKKPRVFKGEKLSKKVHSNKPCSKLHITKKR